MIITPYSILFSMIWGSIFLAYLLVTRGFLLRHNANHVVLLCSFLTLFRFLFIFDIPSDFNSGLMERISEGITVVGRKIFQCIPISTIEVNLWFRHIQRNQIVWFLLLIWVLVILLLISRDIIGLRKNRFNYYDDMSTSSMISRFLEELQYEMKISRKIKVVQSAYVQIPFIRGMIYPTIYLGTSFSESELRTILQHELAHHLYHDNWLKFLLHYSAILLWWNPLIRILSCVIEEACEYRCDKAVTKDMDEIQKIEYASMINRITSVKKGKTIKAPFESALALERRGDYIYDRILTFLRPRMMRPSLKLCYGTILLMILVGSSIFSFPTIEQEYYLPSLPHEIIMSGDNSYLLDNGNGSYSLYSVGRLLDTTITNPEEYDLPIREKRRGE